LSFGTPKHLNTAGASGVNTYSFPFSAIKLSSVLPSSSITVSISAAAVDFSSNIALLPLLIN
jgi:hypothetical protein